MGTEADNSQPVGKQKKVVDTDIFFSAPRNAEGKLTEDIRETINEAEYFNSTSDKVRIVLGKNWDQRLNDGGVVEFKNDWEKPVSFRNKRLGLNACPDGDQLPNDLTLTDLTEKRKFKLQYGGLTTSADDNFPQARLDAWTHYVKTGIIDESSGNEYEPIVKVNTFFTDHYHKTVTPYRIKELESVAASNAVFMDVKTYYNERLDSTNYESTTGMYITNAGNRSRPIQNALPNIYSFVKLFVNDNLMDNDVLDFEDLQQGMQKFYLAGKDSPELKSVYKTLLKTYPLETLLSLYGAIGHTSKFKDEKTSFNFENTKIIENIISNLDQDFDGLFEDYFDEYTRTLTDSLALKNPGHPVRNRVQALENIMTNFVFSPYVLDLNVDQYKKYFPFYAEIEFKTLKPGSIHAGLADMMSKLYLTKFLSETVLMSLKDYNFSWFKGAQQSAADATPSFKPNLPNYQFVDFVSDNDSSSLTTVDKKIILLPSLIRDWTRFSAGTPASIIMAFATMNFEGLYINEQGEASLVDTGNGVFSEGDLRNYMTYFRNDFSEPVNLNDDKNSIFVKIFGSAFLAKLLQTYKDKKRTYEEIINGVPAYTEDLFYRIEKVRINSVTNEEEIVQNILIPNTSELNIAKYVDTQLKYATYATYKYNVYAHRVVFGSKYKYEWIGDTGATATPTKRTLQTLFIPSTALDTDTSGKTTTVQYIDTGGSLGKQTGISQTPGPETRYNATFTTVVEPSIILLEDKIFSTPEILILDKPPVIPDVNILPYRAVNNRLKILLSGAVDRYKQQPIIILDSDVAEFDMIKKSQLVVDEFGTPTEGGHVEFGSDDFVQRFQIFRIMTAPQSYSDFDLYRQIDQEFFEESVLPNTKYYYTFRAIDDHGHISNPTPVYEVELIDEKGAVKPIIRLYDMTPPKNKTTVKACQKYIYVKPALQQLYFSNDLGANGIFSDETTKKKYKLRLTSKGSGKKIDINFSFRKEIKNS